MKSAFFTTIKMDQMMCMTNGMCMPLCARILNPVSSSSV